MKGEVNADEAPALKDDLIVGGVGAIAAEMGETERRTHYLLSKGLVPGAFKRGGRWFALRSKMRAGFHRLASGEAA
jgi:hypothetical protein